MEALHGRSDPSVLTTPLLVDGHLHIYPSHDWQRTVGALVAQARHGQGTGSGQPALAIGCLADTPRGEFFAQAQTARWSGGTGPFTLTPHADGRCLAIQHEGTPCGYLIAGRQIISRERLELLALGVCTTIADGHTAEDTLAMIQQAGGLPVLPWAPGKWFGQRGKVIARILSRSQPRTLLVGDSLLRPTVWPTPRLLNEARQRGFKLLCGSDPLPLPGEERWAGHYASRADLPFSPAQPTASLLELLTAPGALLAPSGRRNGPLDFLSRWLRNQLRAGTGQTHL